MATCTVQFSLLCNDVDIREKYLYKVFPLARHYSSTPITHNYKLQLYNMNKNKNDKMFVVEKSNVPK